MTLSDKIQKGIETVSREKHLKKIFEYTDVEDVKEFIRLLKEKIDKEMTIVVDKDDLIIDTNALTIINKLAGDKLI